jgi:hypothetical protein
MPGVLLTLASLSTSMDVIPGALTELLHDTAKQEGGKGPGAGNGRSLMILCLSYSRE